MTLSSADLLVFLKKQLESFFPDENINLSDELIKKAFNLSLERLEYCFSHIKLRGYKSDGNPFFYHLHSDQYGQFLYYFSNSIYKLSGDLSVSDKLILLNKMLNGCWVTYKVNLPDIFLFSHPVGSVLGDANYSNFLLILQGITINSAYDSYGKRLINIGEKVYLSAGSKIIGNSTIGNEVSIGPDVCIYNRDIPDNHIIYRNDYGKIIVTKRKKESAVKQFFEF